jgi:hypothetical protein
VRRNRANLIVLAGAVALVTIAGLAVHGPVGGVLLLLVAALLVALSVRVWARVPARGRPIRVFVLLLIVGLALMKLADRL